LTAEAQPGALFVVRQVTADRHEGIPRVIDVPVHHVDEDREVSASDRERRHMLDDTLSIREERVMRAQFILRACCRGLPEMAACPGAKPFETVGARRPRQ